MYLFIYHLFLSLYLLPDIRRIVFVDIFEYSIEELEVMVVEIVSNVVFGWFIMENDYWWIWGAIAGILFITLIFNMWNILGVISILGLAVCFIIQPVLYLYADELSYYCCGKKYFVPDNHLILFVLGFIVSSVVWFYALRAFISWWDRARQSLIKRTSLQRDTRTDIRLVGQQLPDVAKQYNPEKYFKKKGQLFLGLNELLKPIYISSELWRSSHCDFIGTTGGGKGVAAGVALTQSVNQGEATIVIDPKNDEFLPYVMGQAAKKARVPYYYIDLLGDSPQWNPFQNKSNYEIEELFSGAFGQASQGGIDDVHRGRDRACARRFASEMVSEYRSTKEVFESLLVKFPGEMKEANKFRDDLEEIVSTPVINIVDGIDLAQAIEEGAVIYVRGSMRNPRALKLQKMFVLSVMQHCENRDRESARHVCIFLDEFKYLISKPALEALGAIRDKRAHVLLAHQSLGDLRDCPKDIDPESIVSSVNENCRLKLAYKINDPDTANWLANMSGRILVDDEMRTIRTGMAMAETSEPERRLMQTERCLVDTNMLLSLPKSCAVLYGNGLACFVFMSPIKVKKDRFYITPTCFEQKSITADILTVHHLNASSVAEEMINVD